MVEAELNRIDFFLQNVGNRIYLADRSEVVCAAHAVAKMLADDGVMVRDEGHARSLFAQERFYRGEQINEETLLEERVWRDVRYFSTIQDRNEYEKVY